MNPYEVLLSNKAFAIIGASNDETRMSNYAYKLLKSKGKHVYPVHPTLETLENDPVYKKVSDIPQNVDVAVFFVNASIGMNALDDVVEKGIQTIWLQPGTLSEELVKKAESLNLNIIKDCVIATYNRNEN